MYDILASKESIRPDSGLLKDSLKTEITRVLDTIPHKEAWVLKMYYGIDQKHSYSLTEIGDRLKLTRERVRQLKNKAIKRLQLKETSKTLQVYLG